MSTTGLLEKIQDGEVQATEPDSPMHGLIVNLALFCQILWNIINFQLKLRNLKWTMRGASVQILLYQKIIIEKLKVK
mgnify:CR=1 FL=1